jgi:hypothetical protein
LQNWKKAKLDSLIFQLPWHSGMMLISTRLQQIREQLKSLTLMCKSK